MLDYTRTPLGIKGSRNFTTAIFQLFSKTVSRHQSIDLILNRLDAGFQLFPQLHGHDFIPLPLRQFWAILSQPLGKLVPALTQVFTKMPQIHTLPTVLIGGNAGNDLSRYRAGYLKALGGFNELVIHHGTIVQHIADIDEAAVEYGLNKVVHIMEVQDAFIVSPGNFLWQQDALCQIPAYYTGDIVALGRCDPVLLLEFSSASSLFSLRSRDRIVSSVELAFRASSRL